MFKPLRLLDGYTPLPLYLLKLSSRSAQGLEIKAEIALQCDKWMDGRCFECRECARVVMKEGGERVKIERLPGADEVGALLWACE